MMKNLEVLISESLFFGLAPLKEARQGISRSISLSLTVMDSEVVSKELLGPTDLAGAQTLCIYESTKVVVVSEDEDLVFAAFQVVTPSLKGFNNSQECGFRTKSQRGSFVEKKRLLGTIGQFRTLEN